MESYYSKNQMSRKLYQIEYNLRAVNQIRHVCECGGKYKQRNKTSHLNTYRHHVYMQSKEIK